MGNKLKIKSVTMCLALTFLACQANEETSVRSKNEHSESTKSADTPFLVILGTVQDAGSPHAACQKKCCQYLFDKPDQSRKVVSLGLINPVDSSSYLFEATPDITSQMKYLSQIGYNGSEVPDAIFLTHAHIGHYTGLMYLGKEAMNANNASVYAMPKMGDFLAHNGPWSQLVDNNNIKLTSIRPDSAILLDSNLKITGFQVPHRDEFSETVGYKIEGPNRSALFIPDIDKWHEWDQSIIEEIGQVDYAFIDATFYDGEEINNRDISEIPHPFIIETMNLLKSVPLKEKKKVHFIHLNHTNPVLDTSSHQYKKVLEEGFNVAQYHSVFEL